MWDTGSDSKLFSIFKRQIRSVFLKGFLFWAAFLSLVRLELKFGLMDTRKLNLWIIAFKLTQLGHLGLNFLSLCLIGWGVHEVDLLHQMHVWRVLLRFHISVCSSSVKSNVKDYLLILLHHRAFTFYLSVKQKSIKIRKLDANDLSYTQFATTRVQNISILRI